MKTAPYTMTLSGRVQAYVEDKDGEMVCLGMGTMTINKNGSETLLDKDARGYPNPITNMNTVTVEGKQKRSLELPLRGMHPIKGRW